MKRTQFKQERKSQKIIIIFSIILILIAAGIAWFYIDKTQKTKVASPKVVKTTKKKLSLTSRVNKFSLNEIIGLVVVYMHKVDNQAQDWTKSYQLGKTDGLQIKKYQQYKFKDFSLKDKKNQLVYVIDNRAAFVFNNQEKRSQAQVLMADSKEKLTKENILKMYQSLTAQERNDWQNISNNLNISSKVSQQKSQKKKTTDSLKLIVVPKNLRGSWYYYSNVKGKQVLEKINLTTHMVRNSMIIDSQEISKNYRGSKGHTALHKLQNKYPDALEGKIIKKGKSLGLLVYDLLDHSNAREQFFVINKVLNITSDGKTTKAYATSALAKKHLHGKTRVEDNEDEDLDLFF